jgi:hypothetical protein
MGKIRKNNDEIAIIADLKEFLDMEVPEVGRNPERRFCVPLGLLIGVAAKKKLEDLDQVPFHLSRLKIELEGKQLKVTFKKIPE